MSNDKIILIQAFEQQHPLVFVFAESQEFHRLNTRRGFNKFMCLPLHFSSKDIDNSIEFTGHVNGIPSTETRDGYGPYPVQSRLRDTFEIPYDIPTSLHLIRKMYKDLMKHGHPTQMRTNPNATATELETIRSLNVQQLRSVTTQDILCLNTPPTPRPYHSRGSVTRCPYQQLTTTQLRSIR